MEEFHQFGQHNINFIHYVKEIPEAIYKYRKNKK